MLTAVHTHPSPALFPSRVCQIDIETGDQHCLKSLLNLPTSLLPSHISVENNHDNDLTLLSTLGYTRFKLVDQRPFGGDSGPFGDHALDTEYKLNWRTLEQMRGAVCNQGQPWCDMHAALPKDEVVRRGTAHFW